MSVKTPSWAMGTMLVANLFQSCVTARWPTLDHALLFSKQGIPALPAMPVNGSSVFRVFYEHKDNSHDIETTLFLTDENRNRILEPTEIFNVLHLGRNDQDQTYTLTNIQDGVAIISTFVTGKNDVVSNIIIDDPQIVDHMKKTILSTIVASPAEQKRQKTYSPAIQ
ncbi:MAG TPA: hypothetical protein VGF14_02315 [Alphaproteobacteria bacterium]